MRSTPATGSVLKRSWSPGRAAHRHEGRDGDGDRRPDKREIEGDDRSPRRADPIREKSCPERCESGHCDRDAESHGDAVSGAGCCGDWRIFCRQRVVLGRVRHAHGRRESDHNRRPDQPEPPRIDCNARHEPDDESRPCTSREREVERECGYGNRRRHDDPHARSARMGSESEREDEPQGGEEAQRVPVAQRLREAIRVDRVVERVEPIRKEAGGERIAACDGDAGQRSRENAGAVAAPKDERYRECDGDVHQHPLDLAHGRRRADRPGRRQRDPHSEGAHERNERDPQPARSCDTIENDQNGRRHEERERDPAPRL